MKIKCCVLDNHGAFNFDELSKNWQNFNFRLLSMEMKMELVPFAIDKGCVSCLWVCFFGKFKVD